MEKRSCADSPPDLRGLGPGIEGLEPYYDLVIVGAGLSGLLKLGVALFLRQSAPSPCSLEITLTPQDRLLRAACSVPPPPSPPYTLVVTFSSIKASVEGWASSADDAGCQAV